MSHYPTMHLVTAARQQQIQDEASTFIPKPVPPHDVKMVERHEGGRLVATDAIPGRGDFDDGPVDGPVTVKAISKDDPRYKAEEDRQRRREGYDTPTGRHPPEKDEAGPEVQKKPYDTVKGTTEQQEAVDKHNARVENHMQPNDPILENEPVTLSRASEPTILGAPVPPAI